MRERQGWSGKEVSLRCHGRTAAGLVTRTFCGPKPRSPHSHYRAGLWLPAATKPRIHSSGSRRSLLQHDPLGSALATAARTAFPVNASATSAVPTGRPEGTTPAPEFRSASPVAGPRSRRFFRAVERFSPSLRRPAPTEWLRHPVTPSLLFRLRSSACLTVRQRHATPDEQSRDSRRIEKAHSP